MRISDWSSDVCSSDLGCSLRAGRPAAGAAAILGRPCEKGREHGVENVGDLLRGLADKGHTVLASRHLERAEAAALPFAVAHLVDEACLLTLVSEKQASILALGA